MGSSVIERHRITESDGRGLIWKLLDRYGSCELVVGLTTGEETLALIQHVKSVTKGLLALNAVLLWENHFSVLTPKEITKWQKQFGVPFRGIDFTDQDKMSDFQMGLIPISYLPALLDEHGVQALLTYHPWQANPFDDWKGEVIISSANHLISGVSGHSLEKNCEPAFQVQ